MFNKWWWLRARMWIYMRRSQWTTTSRRYHGRIAVLLGVAVAVACLVSIGFFIWIAWPRPPLCSGLLRAQACTAMEQGRYDDALADIDAHLKQEPGKKTWPGLKALMVKEMTVRFRLQYLKGGKMPARRVQDGKLTLALSDKYYYVVNPSEPCYLYIFQIGSSGALSQVFPNKAHSATKNPVPAGQQQIPASPRRLELKPPEGTEHVMLVAARWAIPELEALAGKAAGEKDVEKRKQALQRFHDRIDNERRNADRLGGLVFGEARFRNSGL